MAAPERRRTVLFYRDFRKFQGGHLKAFDYFTHVLSSPRHEAVVRFSERSVWDERNPWRAYRSRVLAPGAPCLPDVLFLGGTDWRNLTEAERESPPAPVINLVQHVRHGFPDDPRYPFLRHRAVRICCSEEVAESIRATGKVNGPIFTIPYGFDRERFPAPLPLGAKDLDLLVVAVKQPALGRRLRRRLWRPGRRLRLLEEPVPRPAFLELLNRARVTLFLPHESEGFYIPALEGMALDTVVVCPDCVGNRSFCLPGRNCLRPPFAEPALRAAAREALRLSREAGEALRAGARETFARHDLQGERRRFLEILDDVDRLW